MPGFDQSARERLSRDLKREAARLGFDACGIAEARRLDEEARRLEAWLGAGRQGTMAWMEDHFEKRVDPRRLVPGARSIVSVLHNYRPATQPVDDPATGRISRYAWGDDYHEVLKERLAGLMHWLESTVGAVGGRAFVDSAPVMDKVWAREADRAIEDFCGSCTRCIDACPTGAIDRPYELDASKCISYLTIEHRQDDIDPSLAGGLGNWIFGCDVCQEVCPWNSFSRPASEPRYAPREGMEGTSLREWEELDLEAWRVRFRRNPVKRAKYEGFMRNVRLASENRDRGRPSPDQPR